jgi:hypothetical protein
MARFRFFLMGSSQAPIVEIPVADLGQLGEMVRFNRFLEGRIVDCLDEEDACPVLIPVSRVQMITEVH